MTGLLPVFASLSVYCLWMEIKHGSVARVGKPDKMLTSTAAGVLPKTPTQGSHQCRPVATCYNYLQLYSAPSFFSILSFFCSHMGQSLRFSLSFCWSLPVVYNFLYLSFPSLPYANISPLCGTSSSVLLTFLCPPLLLPILPSIPLSTTLMPVS